MESAHNLPLFDDFLLRLQTDNYSDKTVYNYSRDLKVFDTFLAEISCPFESVTKRVIDQYKAYLTSIDRKTPENHGSKQRLQSLSLNRFLSSLRSYLKYLVEMDHPVPVPSDAVTLVRTERKHPRVAELEELIRLIECPPLFEKDSRIALRNRTMLEVLFSTGMRISELVNLKRSQIDDTGRVFIRGKGKKERFVYLTPRAYDFILQYLNIRKDPLPALFIPYRGKNAQSLQKRISSNYVQERIKFYREQLHINIPISPHSLRHGFATYLAESGANPAAIQILLGHESLETTTRYVHASDRYAEKTHRAFHPLKKK